jgi:hypothetical protein
MRELKNAFYLLDEDRRQKTEDRRQKTAFKVYHGFTPLMRDG